jgi:hypothetical protein
VSVGEDQKERLRRAKLAALARDALGVRGEPEIAGRLTALVADRTAVTLVEQGDAATLAGSLVWAQRRGAARLVLLADEGAPVLARLAGHFTLDGSDVEVRQVDGADLTQVAAEQVSPVEAPPEGAEHLVQELHEAGVDVVVEHGVVRGEVAGLEVARLVEWPAEVGGDGQLHLEVGVGRFDRDATAAARPDEPPAESLARAVAMVAERRRADAGPHPIQRLSRERWLRRTVLDDPSLVGAARLAPAQMTIEPVGLKDPHPAAAVGTDTDGQPLVVVCSTGVDLALVPLAADARALHATGARLVLAVPARDHHPATRTLVELLRDPAQLVDVQPEWG